MLYFASCVLTYLRVFLDSGLALGSNDQSEWASNTLVLANLNTTSWEEVDISMLSISEMIALRMWLQLEDICTLIVFGEEPHRAIETASTTTTRVAECNSSISLKRPFDSIEYLWVGFFRKHNFAGISYTNWNFRTVTTDVRDYGLNSRERIKKLNHDIQNTRGSEPWSLPYYIGLHQHTGSGGSPATMNLPTTLVTNVGLPATLASITDHIEDVKFAGQTIGLEQSELGFTHYTDLNMDVFDVPSNSLLDEGFFSSCADRTEQVVPPILDAIEGAGMSVIAGVFPPRANISKSTDAWWVYNNDDFITKDLYVLKKIIDEGNAPDMLRISDVCSPMDTDLISGDVCRTCMMCTPAMMSRKTVQIAKGKGDRVQLGFPGLTISTPLFRSTEGNINNDIRNRFSFSLAIKKVFDAGVHIAYAPIQLMKTEDICTIGPVGCLLGREGYFGNFDDTLHQIVQWYHCELEPVYEWYTFGGTRRRCVEKSSPYEWLSDKEEFKDLVKQVVWHKLDRLLRPKDKSRKESRREEDAFNHSELVRKSLLPIQSLSSVERIHKTPIGECSPKSSGKCLISEGFEHQTKDGHIKPGLLDRNVLFMGGDRDQLEVALFAHAKYRGKLSEITWQDATLMETTSSSAILLPTKVKTACTEAIFYELSKNAHEIIVIFTSDPVVNRIYLDADMILQTRDLVTECPNDTRPCVETNCGESSLEESGDEYARSELQDIVSRYQRSINPSVKIVIASFTSNANNIAQFSRPDVYMQTWTGSLAYHDEQEVRSERWRRLKDGVNHGELLTCEPNASDEIDHCQMAMTSQPFINEFIRKLTVPPDPVDGVVLDRLTFQATVPFVMNYWNCWNHYGNHCATEDQIYIDEGGTYIDVWERNMASLKDTDTIKHLAMTSTLLVIMVVFIMMITIYICRRYESVETVMERWVSEGKVRKFDVGKDVDAEMESASSLD